MFICTSCPRNCGMERKENTSSKGFCKMPYNAVIARASLHFGEEPLICGEGGSGAIFFSGCSMKCVFCQNYEISHNGFGKSVSKQRFIEIIKELEAQGAGHINLVNPTHFTPFIKEALNEYKPTVPIVYNSSGYDTVESLKSLEGLIDIYLPDLKYYDNEIAKKYSSCPNYFDYASQAILEMHGQVGENVIENGLMKKGIIIRHLILPKSTDQSIKILRWIKDNLPMDTYISIMSQYTPCGRSYEHKELNRGIVTAELQRVLDEFVALGFINGFTQDRNSSSEDFIPSFDLTGV